MKGRRSRRRIPTAPPYCATTSGCTPPIMNVPKQTPSLALVYTTKVLRNYELTGRILTADNTSFQFNIPGLTRFTTNQPRTFGSQINHKL